MDAQNAGTDKTKPAASPKRQGEPDETAKTSVKPHAKPSASPTKEAKLSKDVSQGTAADGETGGEGNSDAETIVLPGKDGHSPSKARKVKHEDKSDAEAQANRRSRDAAGAKDSSKSVSAGAAGPTDDATSLGIKKKRLPEKPQQRSKDNKDGKDGSSGLSSAPTSPPPHRRRSADARSGSESEALPRKSPKIPSKERPRPTDKPVSHKRKALKAESDDEADNRKVRRQRTSGAGVEATHPGRPNRDHKPSSSKGQNDAHPSSRTRSVSPPPPPRSHRRSISTQLPSQSANGLSQKKKRVPAPLQSTDYHSDDSSASGSPHPRSSKLRTLSTPHTAEPTISPAKMAPHKKHLDAHGQTFLARACARCEYDVAKQRLGERPEDLNVADYAGNTPLQIASINGCEDIVKLLIDAGCNLDCVNYDKDTPLLDAVDNGHLGVIKLLLGAGVNPRKANVNGEEPLDRVSDDMENAAEIRALLSKAKQKHGEKRRTSEDHHQHDHHDARSSHGPDSPRRSPTATTHSVAAGRRGGTVRATKTSERQLYITLDDKTLRSAASKGDEETVTRVLQVRDGCDDPESMVAAARGGHDLVMQLLLALGGANPDPNPVSSVQAEFATPMLAAIGQENVNVIRLLLDQSNFDPTRRFRGEYYHEIARRRQGPYWKEEEQVLKDAFDKYRKTHKDTSKKSPNRQREPEREARRVASKNDTKDDGSRSHKRNLSSPSREEPRKKLVSGRATTSPKEKRRSNPFNQQDDQSSPKRGPGRQKKDDRVPTVNVSDREASPTVQKHAPKPKRTESDVAGVSSEGEAIKPRRKLISKGELRGEREKEKQRRASMVSTTSSLKEPSSPQSVRTDDHHPERQKGEPLSEKYHSRTKALKRDESKDRLGASGDHATKRHRSSVTPPRQGATDKDETEVPPKRRRLDMEGKERRSKQASSADDRPSKPSREGNTKLSKSSSKEHEEDNRRDSTKTKSETESRRRESGRSSTSDKSSIHVKSEDIDIEMPDAADIKQPEDEARTKREREEEEKRQVEAAEARKKEEERKRREAEEKKQREEEEAKKREEEARKREEEERKRKEEEEEKKRQEEERKRKEEEERRIREEEEKRRREEEEKKRQEEEERKRREEEERKRREEEERKAREEEERLRREQLEREAAEAARRKREEEERKERERKERLLREEMERKRAAREAEQRRIFEEQERLRLAKLPPLLRWLDRYPNPKSPEVAARFKHMQGVRYDTIKPEATGTPDGREQWVLNTQVALLLGEKDLDLSRYTAWERIPVSSLAKKVIWRLESDRYALTSDIMYDLGSQLPNYYEGPDPNAMDYRVTERLRGAAWEKFLALDMFFVKVSDLMYIIPNIPHLRGLKLAVEYRELPEDETQLLCFKVPQKWKQDPDADRFHGFAPRNKYYLNGELVDEQKPVATPTSKTPFPEKRAPRRGLMSVSPTDPDYARLCREQGLEHLLTGSRSPSLPNGTHSPAIKSNVFGNPHGQPVELNGARLVLAEAASSDAAQPWAVANGINGITTNGGS